MKRTAVILLVCMLAALCSNAFAEGITLVSQSEYVCRDFSTSGYGRIYAEVRNDTDAPVELSELCDVRFYDKQGEVIQEYTNCACAPAVLLPGESGYISEEVFLNTDLTQVGKGELTLHPNTEPTDFVTTRTPVTATLDLDALEAADGEACYIFLELDNTTDELMGEFSLSAAMWNQNNEIMYAYSGYVSALVPPGEKGYVRMELPYSLVEAWREAGHTPTYLECFSYQTHTVK